MRSAPRDRGRPRVSSRVRALDRVARKRARDRTGARECVVPNELRARGVFFALSFFVTKYTADVYRDRPRRPEDDGGDFPDESWNRLAPRRPRLDLGARAALSRAALGGTRERPPVRLSRASCADFFLRASETARELVALSMGRPSLTALSISPARTRSFLATRLVTLPPEPARAVRPER